ncbi:GtrA family protein [Naasia lichenicola]|uniref:GtrA family protein n=1 Tax=Naasia lichenicola TaxID=2565933 RepID=UPI00130D8B20|nr:GtrA family protein [Naasia lichenicola]
MPPRSPFRQLITAYAVYLPLQIAVLALMRAIAPRFFWFDDSEAQFGPAWWWLGRTAHGGIPALMDPDLGVAGAFTVDIQYGALDPLHWIVQAIISHSDDYLTVSWIVAGISMLVLGTGVVALAWHLRAHLWLVVGAAIGVATGGFLMWFGSAWWPMLWSVGWLVWFWFGLSTRTAVGAIAAGVGLTGVLASGNPYLIPFAVLVFVVEIVQRRRAYGSWRSVLTHAEVLGRALACVGGALVAAPTLLTLVGSTSVLERPTPSGILANTGFAVPNLLDAALGGATLTGELNAWGGAVAPVMALSTAIFAVPLLAFVDWPRAVRLRGVPTALALVAVALLATQLPAVIGGFRVPLRYVVVAQTALPILAAVAVSGARRVTRGRIILAGSLVAGQVLLAAFRSPRLVEWHIVGGLVTAAVVIAAMALLARNGRWRVAAAVLLVLGTASTWFIQERAMVSLETTADRQGVGTSSVDGAPYRLLRSAQPATGVTEQSYRERSILTDTSVTVLDWTASPDRGWETGVMEGNGNLLAGLKPGFGSLAIGQKDYQRHVCEDYLGLQCGGPADSGAALLEREPLTGETWLDLTSQDRIVLAQDAPAAIRAYLDEEWTLTDESSEWRFYERNDELPGRITWAAAGVTIASKFASGPAYVGQPMDEYTVTASDGGAVVLAVPFWPGITATLDGRNMPVSTLDGAIVEIDLPAGTEAGRLEVAYAPIGVRVLIPAVLIGALAVIAGAGLIVFARARRLRLSEERRERRAAERGEPTAPSRLTVLISQLLRFLWSACAGLGVDLGLYALLTHLGVEAGLSNVISSGAAVVVLYLLITRYTFGQQATVLTFALFVGWYVLSISVFSLIIQWGVDGLGLHPLVSKAASLPLSFLANFLFGRLLFARFARPRAGADPEGGSETDAALEEPLRPSSGQTP